jgi:hypothetical protein
MIVAVLAGVLVVLVVVVAVVAVVVIVVLVVVLVVVVLVVVPLYRHLQKSEVALCGFHTKSRCRPHICMKAAQGHFRFLQMAI